MRTKKALISTLLGFMLVFVGCEEVPSEPVAQKEEIPPEPVDGQSVFFRTFVAARGWARDAQGLRLESHVLEEIPREGGKFGAWRATFVSPSKKRGIVFNFAVLEVGGKWRKGVFQDHEEGFSGGLSKPWPAVALRTSSDKAVEVAMARKEAKEYVAKNPDVPIMIILEQTNRHPSLAWRVVWGQRVSTSGFSVYVDASTGEFLEVMR